MITLSKWQFIFLTAFAFLGLTTLIRDFVQALVAK